MKIEKIYIGGWFQRTTLHLTEIYDFLRESKTILSLDKEKLIALNNSLNIKEVNFAVNGLEYIICSTTIGIDIKIFEDGLIVLSDTNSDENCLFNDIESLANYYEKKLSPALTYIFNLGAPVPKELANIQNVYPYFIVLKNETEKNIIELLSKTDKQKYFKFSNENFDIIRGDKYYFINNKNKSLERVERYIEEQIFIREFKGQLHRYLNLHRIIWEKIAKVKESNKVKGKQIVEFTSKIDGYAKTINLVDTRINQMNTYLRTREKIAKNDQGMKEFLDFMEYRYETLGDTLSYIQQIWAMTKNYVNSASTLFNKLEQKITQKTLNNLTIVTSMGVGASLIGLFTTSKVPTFSVFGVSYFLILAIVGFCVNKTLKYIAKNRSYQISDITYDKDIK